MINDSPQKITVEDTDYRFPNELKREPEGVCRAVDGSNVCFRGNLICSFEVRSWPNAPIDEPRLTERCGTNEAS